VSIPGTSTIDVPVKTSIAIEPVVVVNVIVRAWIEMYEEQ
jgi:hypothetical protein